MNRAAQGLYSSYASPTDYEAPGERCTRNDRAKHTTLHALRANCIKYFCGRSSLACLMSVDYERLRQRSDSGAMTALVEGTMNPIFAGSKINRWLQVSSLRRNAAFALVGIFAVSFANSCSTTRGFGRDVEKTGDKIQEAASQ